MHAISPADTDGDGIDDPADPCPLLAADETTAFIAALRSGVAMLAVEAPAIIAVSPGQPRVCFRELFSSTVERARGSTRRSRFWTRADHAHALGEGANDSAFCRGLHLLAGSPSLDTLRISKADLRGRALEPLRTCARSRSTRALSTKVRSPASAAPRLSWISRSIGIRPRCSARAGGARAPSRGGKTSGAAEGATWRCERPQIRVRRHRSGRRSPIWRREDARSRRVDDDAAASRARLCSRRWVGALLRRAAAAKIAEDDDARRAAFAGALVLARPRREAVTRARPGTRRLGLRALGARLRRARWGGRRRRAHQLDVLHLDDVARFALVAAGLLAVGKPAPSLEEALARDLVGQHLRGFARARPCEIESDDPVAVRDWVEARLGYGVAVPAPEGVELIGARACTIGGQATAALLYRHEGAPITLFVPPPGSEAVASAARFASSGSRCVEGPIGERICVSGTASQRAFAVADLPEEQVLPLLVR